jgi:hypothetical protein
MYNILTRWFEHFQQRNTKIPPNFDVHILINVMVILFNSQHALGITSALNFWYSFSELFSIETNIYFLRIFVKYFFFKLVLHWSSNVRESLNYFICYRVLYHLEKRSDLPALDRVCLRINRYLNVISKVGQMYAYERYKWDNKTKLEKCKEGLDAIKARIIAEAQKLMMEVPTDNFFGGSQKFTQIFDRPRKNSDTETSPLSMMLRTDGMTKTYDEDNFDQSLLSIKDSKKHFKLIKMRDYRVKLTKKSKKSHLSAIKLKNISYCLPALSDFKKIKDRFYVILNSEGSIPPEKMPKLSLKVLVDEFEFIDTDDIEW